MCSFDILTNLRELQQVQGCQIVWGDLIIAKIAFPQNELIKAQSFLNDLIEITGSLFLYDLKNVISLQSLFPNLRVIRGNSVNFGHSLVLFYMPHFERVSLGASENLKIKNLKIENNKNFCIEENLAWFVSSDQLEPPLSDTYQAELLKHLPYLINENYYKNNSVVALKTIKNDFYFCPNKFYKKVYLNGTDQKMVNDNELIKREFFLKYNY